MRSPVDADFRLFALALSAVALTGCGLVGGGARPTSLVTAPVEAVQAGHGIGPAADYPMVLGEPFTIDGELYTPADTLNYDAVGYAGLDEAAGITVAHRTLPLPSYVEVTSLTTGKTILARVERRGPMSGASLFSLSAAAAAQLGDGEGAPVRVRRVNPPETDRAELRAGRAAVARIDTPKALVEVLRRKLPASGSASLRPSISPRPATVAAVTTVPAAKPEAGPAEVRTSAEPIVAAPIQPAQSVSAYPLAPLAARTSKPAPAVVARAEPLPVDFKLSHPGSTAASPAPATRAASKAAAMAATGAEDGFVVQAGAFANSANAERAAKALGGFVSPAGKLFRVRTGPFADRRQAEAALAKVRAAGYSDARVYTAG